LIAEADVSPNLLVTKLYTPLARKNLVQRQRLIQLLNDAWQQDKTVLSQPQLAMAEYAGNRMGAKLKLIQPGYPR
jgi:hypothetical protein